MSTQNTLEQDLHATLPSKTFREVHAEIEAESLLLSKNHNVQDYAQKANFLNNILTLTDLNEIGMSNYLVEIAAVKTLFSPEAFKESQQRILDLQELAARNQVELDPIVLVKTKNGRLIPTAWGDEANDELVVNHKLN